MGSLFRSEEMQLSQIFLYTDTAYMCISELGELGLVQFRDTIPGTSAFQRKFVNEVRRCDEMERRLRFLEMEIEKVGFPILDTGEDPEAIAPREIIEMEGIFEKLENELHEVNNSLEGLNKTYVELTELKQVLLKTQTIFDETQCGEVFVDRFVGVVEDMEAGDIVRRAAKAHLQSLAGVINRERLPAFERMLWRTCRGNVFLKQAEINDAIEDPVLGTKLFKSVFLVFFQGDQLRNRVKKMCAGFHANIYPCPESQSDRRNMVVNVMGKLQDLETILLQTKDHRQRILEMASQNLRVWFIKVRKIKAIYHTLNLFNVDVTTKFMIGECWCAVSDVDQIQMALRRGMERSNSSLQPILNGLSTHESPPTYHRTNKFTSAFQTIIDAYGVARYREVNPALFTVITFPFLFAVMFGDAGHGLIMLLFAAWMIATERKHMAKKSDDEIWNTFFGGRYIILLMGIFSVYTGLIYNDIFSRSANIFGSSWYPNYDNQTVVSNDNLQLNPVVIDGQTDRMYAGYPYPVGLDPIWQLANNKVMLTNSIKMKMSVVLGVLHMLMGVLLGLFNHSFFKNHLLIWCELVPQVLFLASIFLYLVVLIFYKWIAYTAVESNTAPSLLLIFINMVSFKYETSNPPGPGDVFYPGQKGVQIFLVIIAVICVPWLLLAKPLILLMRHRAISKGREPSDTDSLQHPYRSLSNPSIVSVVAEDNLAFVEDDERTSGGLPKPSPTVHQWSVADQDSGKGFGSSSISIPLAVDQHPHQNEAEARATVPLSSSAAGGSEHNLSSEKMVIDDDVQKSGSTVGTDSLDVEIEPFVFSDIMVYQSIHTIEYCLGCISNTASYLRLWALSLAHAQLSEVVWNMVMRMGMTIQALYGGVFLVFIFAFWAILTVSILLVMEGLSAFLHTLRLHWVEFQNKFYSGDGYLFMPFSFKQYVNAKSDI